jgi:hypothetical protein
VAAAKPERPEPGTPTPKPEPSVVKSPPRNRSRTCWKTVSCCSASPAASRAPVFFLCPTAPPRRRVQECEVSFPLHLAVDPAFEPRLDRALCARCLFVDRCPAPRRRADPPSLESRPSSRAGRFTGAAAVVAARAPLPCNGVVPLFRRAHAEFRLAVGTHTLSTPPSSEGPAFIWPGVV